MRAAILTFAIAGLLLPTTALAQKIAVDHDKKADFAKYRTWTFRDGTPAENPFNQARIEGAVGAQLAKKGLAQDTGRADLLVVMHAGAEVETRLQTWDTGAGYYRWRGGFGGGMATTTVYKDVVGTLTVDLIDAETGQLVWRGTATDKIDANPEKNEKRINTAAEKMFKKFPANPAP